MGTPMSNAEMEQRLNLLLASVRDAELEACNLHDVSDGPYRHATWMAFKNLESAESAGVDALRTITGQKLIHGA